MFQARYCTRSTQCLKKPWHTTLGKAIELHYSAHNLFALYMSMTQISAGKIMIDSPLGHIRTINSVKFMRKMKHVLCFQY